MTDPPATSKGLEHVVLGDSAITLVAGETGGLTYRGFDIDELVPSATYEGVVSLLLDGSAPAVDPPSELSAELVRRRQLDDRTTRLADAVPLGLPPLEAMRSLLSLLGGPAWDYPPTRAQGLELVAKTPALLARYVRCSAGKPPVADRPDLGHAANYLSLLTGEAPTPERARALEQYLVLLADHGMNASTFALRIVVSTQSDLISAAVAALGALKGPAHGGAPARVSDMLDGVGTPDNAERWVAAALARKERLYGFGHRAYKTDDPRAVQLKRIARTIADPSRFALAEAVEHAGVAALQKRRPEARLFMNVEFYGAVVLEAVGLPRELFTPTFAVARTAGWAAHALEQASDNRLIRPDVRYTGPAPGRKWPTKAR
ncbi:MAG: citrate synthase [Thermoplasmata archaeon]|nr:citrate synthase [Thermoplasmata archaeon]MCI4355521.1 citrate synthase [Thermoplasmata archaeon]